MRIQSDVYVIVLLTLLLLGMILWLSHKIKTVDPFAKPTGLITTALLGVESVYNMVANNVGKRLANHYVPYILVLWVYIFLANIISLFGIASPTANLSVTLLLAIITWLLIQYVELKYGGLKGYMHSFIEPIAVMLPMNIFGKFSTMISMSLRLFGNILCGGIMMQLVYSACGSLSNVIAKTLFGLPHAFNFVAPLLAPVLHVYFDLFAGFIQTLVFVTLTVVLIGNDIPEEVKKV